MEGRLLISLGVSLSVSLTLTLALELGFAAAVGVRANKDLLLVLAVNVLTNPAAVLLNTLASAYLSLSPVLVIAALEIAVVLTEAAYYRSYSGIRRPFLFSAAANAVSFGTGALLNALISGG